MDAFPRGGDGLWRFRRRTFDQLKLADFLQVDADKAAIMAQPAAMRGPQERPA